MQKHALQLNYKILITYIAAFLALVIIQVGIIAFVDMDSWTDASLATFGASMNLLLYGSLTIIFLFMANIYLFKNQWVYFKERMGYSVLMIAFGMYLIFAVLILVGAIFEITGGPNTPQNQELLDNILASGWHNALMVFMFAVFFAPIVEELVFRKAIFGLIDAKFGGAVAIIGNSLIFASIHITGEFTAWISGAITIVDLGLVILPYMAMSLIISFIYFYSGKLIWVAILVHFIINFISVSGTLLSL